MNKTLSQEDIIEKLKEEIRQAIIALEDNKLDHTQRVLRAAKLKYILQVINN